jgi:hypothetical protein
VVHTCNPSYSGGRDQEDRGSKPAGQTVQKILPRKNPSGGVVQYVVPEFKPQYHKKKKKYQKYQSFKKQSIIVARNLKKRKI